MASTQVIHGITERIYATVQNSSGPMTGLTDVLLTIRRKSDGRYLDFADTTFKASGWTTREGVMAELSATLAAGTYYYDFATSAHSSRYVEETYLLRTSSATATNDPLEGELRVGGWIDLVSGGGGNSGTGNTHREFTLGDAEKVWQVILEKKKTAREVLLERSTFNAETDVVRLAELAQILGRMEELKAASPDLGGKLDQLIEGSRCISTLEASVADLKASIVGLCGAIPGLLDPIQASLDNLATSEQVDGVQSLVLAVDGMGQKLAEMAGRTDTMGESVNQSLATVGSQVAAVSESLATYQGLLDQLAHVGSSSGENTASVLAELRQFVESTNQHLRQVMLDLLELKMPSELGNPL